MDLTALSRTRLAIASPWSRFAFWVLALIASAALFGCSSGGGMDSNPQTSGTPSSQSCNASDCGPLFIGITDADGDFLSYSVDVVSLTLKKANGAVVETLPVSTRVDFAQLVDLTEFVTAATIPNGTYVEGTMQLDYSNADVTVEVNGEPRAATIVGQDGQPLGQVDVQIMLDNRNHVVIAPGRPAFLQLDFDLAASHTVDTTTTPVRAVAEPFIVASIEPVDDKELRVRGPLLSVDTAASSYLIDVRPFNLRDARLGQFTVHTTSSTDFEINGDTFTGAAGLEALAQLGAGTATAAFGTLDIGSRSFTAERVHAGTSVPGSQFDVLSGNVTARNGSTLTVRGGTMIRRSGSVIFIRDDITLLVGPDTAVIRDGQMGNTLGDGAISVGQRIRAFGSASESDSEVTFDAQQGRVRLELTHLLGTVVSASPGNLALDLTSIDGRRLNIFDFTGTGAAPDADANPDNYEIVTGNLSLSRLAERFAGSRVWFRHAFRRCAARLRRTHYRRLPGRARTARHRLGAHRDHDSLPEHRCAEHRDRQCQRKHRPQALHRHRPDADRHRDLADGADPRAERPWLVRDRTAAPRGGLQRLRRVQRTAQREACLGQQSDRVERGWVV